MTVGLISMAILAGVVVLLGLLLRHSMRAASRFMFAPDMDEEWAARLAIAQAAGPQTDKSGIARTPAPAVNSESTN